MRHILIHISSPHHASTNHARNQSSITAPIGPPESNRNTTHPHHTIATTHVNTSSNNADVYTVASAESHIVGP
jgi:hypothetical protein